MSPPPTTRTRRGRAGIAAETVARRHLDALGWRVMVSNLVVGNDELDLVALEPGEVETIVFVEVRGLSTGRFGAPEESVDARKLGRTYRAVLSLLRSDWIHEAGLARGMPWRVDVIAVDLAPSLGRGLGGPAVRHIRGVSPS